MPKNIFGRNYKFKEQNQLLNYKEIIEITQAFANLGVEKIRLTGGEPLLRHDLEDLISGLSTIKEIQDIALTTNGSLLTKERTKSIRAAGINRLNISLDALDEKTYATINEINYPVHKILNGIDHALDANFDSVKINMVVQAGVNEHEIIPMVRHFRSTGAILRFIEFMDVGNFNQWSESKVFRSQAIIDLIHSHYPIVPVVANYHGEVANRWQYKDGKGEIGVISSVTEPFCGDCQRARLSAIGEIFTCLFATNGFDIRPILRNSTTSSHSVEDFVRNLWSARRDRYSLDRRIMVKSPSVRKVEMSYIGG